MWTDGATNTAVLGVENVKQEDEGAYKCILNDDIEHEFSIYVTGMHFFGFDSNVALAIWMQLNSPNRETLSQACYMILIVNAMYILCYL